MERTACILDRDQFELSARANLEHAAAILEAEANAAAQGGRVFVACHHADAVGTIRELLRLDEGVYFDLSPI